tara:strand:+ start:2103 stop:2792 length:690 start_codon:yes stop_codon:yes gene_type:complete
MFVAAGQAFSMAGKSARHPHQEEFQRVILSLKLELEERVYKEEIPRDRADVIFNLVMAKIQQNLGNSITANTLRFGEADFETFKLQLESLYQQALTEVSGFEEDERALLSTEMTYELIASLEKLRMYCFIKDHQVSHNREDLLFSHYISSDLSPDEQPIRGLTRLPTESRLRESFYSSCNSFMSQADTRPSNSDWICVNIQNKTATCIDPRQENIQRVKSHLGIEIPRI